MKWWVVGLVVALGLCINGGRIASAATKDNADWLNAVNTAPPGVPLDGLFTMSGEDNFTTIIDSKVVPRSIAQITRDSTNSRDVQSGAVWSKTGVTRMDNRLDLSRNEDISLWLYFGNKHAAAAEGMAFVLQNQGNDFDDIGTGRESLGVWGNDRNSLSDTGLVWSALKKSWALEFDTRPNISTESGAGDAFDIGTTTEDSMHIASGYPASLKTYKDLGGYRSLNHTKPKAVADFADGQWHHLSLHWDAQAKTMAYVYNDRDPKTNTHRSGMDIVADTLPIDVSQLEVSKTQPNVYWGITGSTSSGTASENSLVVVDRSDSLGQLDATAALRDSTGKKIPAGGTVAPGEKVTYQYTFKYDDALSHAYIQPLTMQIPLPPQLQWQDGGVSYNGGAVSEPFSTNELAQPEIKKAWQKTLDGKTTSVTVTANAIVPKVTQKTLVDGVNSRFYGPNFQTQLSLPSYYIRGDVSLKLANLGADAQQLAYGDSATITGQLTNAGNLFSPDALDNYRLQAKIGEKSIPISELAGTQLADHPSGTFQLTVKPDQLVQGDNVLTLMAVAKNDAKTVSNEIKIKLHRAAGTLHFTQLPHGASFMTTRLTGQTMRIKRDKGWQLGVRDERGAGQRWRLNVALDKPFVDDQWGTPLRGHLLFSQPAVRQPQIVDTADVTVVSEHETQTDAEETNVAGDWDATSGPSLVVDGDAIQGNYTGQLVWKLVDAP
ncbi:MULTISPECIES: hypothetical protein [Lactobacillaceae]|uniref:lectin-like domain-containing protein n=1 Tax=Lactobacillaceae TaxID=33958 RepID=UPI001456374C|nr:hypothetical protein [Lactobacillus sp. HBUAS51381]NLR10397.1 hypothetical protein [Lactobacillus sp. HBUAS51381]